MRTIPHPYMIGLKRKAIASVLATIIIFASLFAIGVGFLVFQNQNTLSAIQANNNREGEVQQASMEKLSVSASVSGSTVLLGITNRGGVSTTIVDAFVANANGVLQSPPGIIPNPCSQPTLNIGSSGSCTLSGYTYTPSTTVYLSLITSRGNTFTVQYPAPSNIITTTSTSTVGTVSSSTLPYIGIGSNALVIDMVASPPVAFTCTSGCVVVTVTLYNYQSSGVMTNVALDPNPPTVTLCTGNVPGCTATVTPCTLSGATCTPTVPPSPPSTCAGPYNSNGSPDTTDSIPAYSGSGVASDIYYLCYYNANTGVVGGFATFSGEATGYIGTTEIASALATSNAIKIGGSANVLNQGPFSANFFYFHYTSCTATPCTSSSENPGFSGSPNLPTGPLPNGYLISGNNYNVAYYIQITNNFNVSLPILQYTYFQTDSTLGNDADFFIVGPSSNSTFYSLPTNANSPGPAYYPTYTVSSPSLQAYTGSVYACDPSLGGSASNCIDVNPGKTVTLTLAACEFGSNSWDWYNQPNGENSGGGSIGCSANGATTNSPSYTPPEATWLGIIIFFVYNGQVYAQQIPFAGDLVCNSNC
jgi:hypothetical protein